MYGHVEVYIDESGDLGFSRGSTEHFIVAAMAVPKGLPLAMATNKCRRRFKSSLKGNPEVKFNRCGAPVRRFILEAVHDLGPTIVWSGVRKSFIPTRLRSDKDWIWRWVACMAVSEVSRTTSARRMDVVVDRRSVKKVARRTMEGEIEEAILGCHAGVFPPDARVSHVDSFSSAGLQLVDHIAGAVFQHLERGNSSYLEIVKDRVVHGELLF